MKKYMFVTVFIVLFTYAFSEEVTASNNSNFALPHIRENIEILKINEYNFINKSILEVELNKSISNYILYIEDLNGNKVKVDKVRKENDKLIIYTVGNFQEIIEMNIFIQSGYNKVKQKIYYKDKNFISNLKILSPNLIKFTFNEGIDSIGKINTFNFEGYIQKIVNNEVYIMSEDNLKQNINYEIQFDYVKNKYEQVDNNIVYYFNYNQNNIEMKIESLETISDNEILITFNEYIQEMDFTNKISLYEFYAQRSIKNVYLLNNKKQLLIESYNANKSGEYRLKINNLENTFGNKFSMEHEFEIQKFTYYKYPLLEEYSIDNNNVTLKFNKAVKIKEDNLEIMDLNNQYVKLNILDFKVTDNIVTFSIDSTSSQKKFKLFFNNVTDSSYLGLITKSVVLENTSSSAESLKERLILYREDDLKKYYFTLSNPKKYIEVNKENPINNDIYYEYIQKSEEVLIESNTSILVQSKDNEIDEVYLYNENKEIIKPLSIIRDSTIGYYNLQFSEELIGQYTLVFNDKSYDIKFKNNNAFITEYVNQDLYQVNDKSEILIGNDNGYYIYGEENSIESNSQIYLFNKNNQLIKKITSKSDGSFDKIYVPYAYYLQEGLILEVVNNDNSNRIFIIN